MKYILFFSLLFLPFLDVKASQSYYSIAGKEDSFKKFQHAIVGSYPYEGDSKGYFVNDPVIVLENGSEWKVHPSQVEQFKNWQTGEVVHAGVRREWYWFKREHKFYLFNHNRNEQIKVMLIKSPYTVKYVNAPQPTMIIYHSQGGMTYTDFRRNIVLNNDSKWNVDSFEYDDNGFLPDTPAYPGYNESKGYASFFIISGTGQTATWQWTKVGNINYYFHGFRNSFNDVVEVPARY